MSKPEYLGPFSLIHPAAALTFIVLTITVSAFLFDTQPKADTVPPPIRGEWMRVADSPLSARNDASIAWTGDEFLVFGGTQFFCADMALCAAPTTPPFADGAAYNPTTDSWRLIAEAPIGIISSNIAMIGADVYALSYTSFLERSIRLLRYQSTLDIWDELNLPEPMLNADLVALGTDVIFFARSEEDGPTTDWRLNTLTGEWESLPDDPLSPGFGRQFVAYNDDLYLFDHELVPSPGGASGPSYLRAAKFHRQLWSVLPTANSIGFGEILVADSRLIAPMLGCADGGSTNGYGRCIAFGAVLDTTTDTWKELPNAPERSSKHAISSGGLSEDSLVLSQAGYPALDATSNEWFTVPKLNKDRISRRTAKAAGPYGFSFGGYAYPNSGNGVLLNEAWIWIP